MRAQCSARALCLLQSRRAERAAEHKQNKRNLWITPAMVAASALVVLDLGSRRIEGARQERKIKMTDLANQTYDQLSRRWHFLKFVDISPLTDVEISNRLTEIEAIEHELKIRSIKFEIGKTYITRSICDHDCIYRFEVIARTKKFLTLREHGEVYKRGVYDWNGVEHCKPHGTYSMCAIISADQPQPFVDSTWRPAECPEDEHAREAEARKRDQRA
jgi:hypothetical protein